MRVARFYNTLFLPITFQEPINLSKLLQYPKTRQSTFPQISMHQIDATGANGFQFRFVLITRILAFLTFNLSQVCMQNRYINENISELSSAHIEAKWVDVIPINRPVVIPREKILIEKNFAQVQSYKDF